MRFQFLTYQNRWDTVTVWGLGGNRGWDRPTDYRVSDDIRYRPASDPQTQGDTQYNRTHVHRWVSRRLPAPRGCGQEASLSCSLGSRGPIKP